MSRKVPYTPGTDSMAASNRPRDWRSFRAACKDVEEGKRQHIGFCFSSSDPYTFIDLDDPEDEDQIAIFKRLNTYAQRSVSGEGCHLICKGSFEGAGKHPSHPDAGIFKENRFCLMTGDIVEDRNTINVVADADLQAIHTWLGGGNEKTDEDLVEYETEIPDQTVFDMGCDRFDKFESMCCGDWQKYEEYYGDHSTADHAFIAMLCDLTESNEQVRWFFAHSGMWNEERAAKKAGHGFVGYVNRTIKKIRGNQSRDREMMSRVSLCFKENEPEPLEALPPANNDLIDSLPEGLIKDLARYSMATSFYALPEASFCFALSLLSGITGRAYQTPTHSGLNLWTILVGDTSCGKDEYQAGMNRVISSLEKRGLKSLSKLLGGELVSGPAMEQVFSDRKRYISYMPEFGEMFRTLVAPGAPDHIRTLNRGLLNSYNAAGLHGSLRARRKAQGTESGVESIERPCLVLAGESTPEAMYGNVGHRELATGFLQRFILVDVPKSSWSLEENKRSAKAPPKELLDRLEQLVVLCDSMEVEQRKGLDHVVVGGTPEALERLHRYRASKRREIMSCPDGLAKKEVINRAGLKALRIACLMAVSADFHSPQITLEHAEWAIRFVDAMDASMLARFTSGEVGSGQTKQESEIRKAAKSLVKLSVADRRKLGMNKEVAKEADMLPLSVLKARVVQSAAFSADRVGAVTAFERCVDSLVRSGFFSKVKEDVAMDRFAHTMGVLLCVRG
jgi:Protein of unknown function (DUF3987)